jgi:hypothetical protein
MVLRVRLFSFFYIDTQYTQPLKTQCIRSKVAIIHLVTCVRKERKESFHQFKENLQNFMKHSMKCMGECKHFFVYTLILFIALISKSSLDNLIQYLIYSRKKNNCISIQIIILKKYIYLLKYITLYLTGFNINFVFFCS